MMPVFTDFMGVLPVTRREFHAILYAGMGVLPASLRQALFVFQTVQGLALASLACSEVFIFPLIYLARWIKRELAT
jgi:hypothetical protein